MSRRLLAVGVGVLAGAMFLGGCATTSTTASHMPMDPVMPRAGEVITPYLAIVMADASGSMGGGEFAAEHAAVMSLVSAMPDGRYGAAVRSFGGSDVEAWQWNDTNWFSRAQHLAEAANLESIGGLTPLSTALNRLHGDWAGRERNGALILFSDGRVEDHQAVVDAAAALVAAHKGRLCIYTVQVGADPAGAATLQAVADASGCGNSRTLADIGTPEGMENFVREVFFAHASRLDSDGDGVYDDMDECPNTPRGARVDARGCWVIMGLNFDTDKSVIKPEFEGLLDEVAGVLRQNPGVRVRVDGHTDSRASDAYNQGLSERRAAAVRAALDARGVGASIASSQGFGESSPAAPNTSASNMYLNRRVELTVVE